MSNFFNKFFMPFTFGKKNNKYLPAPKNGLEPFVTNKGDVVYSAKPYKTIATFDLEVATPKYEGEIPCATIKFYPLEK